MKNKDYWGDPRYFKLWEKMEMLGIKDISSPCQDKNGTVDGDYLLKTRIHAKVNSLRLLVMKRVM
jgi:hypothetical protein